MTSTKLVTRLRLVTHHTRGSASQYAGRAGKLVRSQAEPGNEVVENVYSTGRETRAERDFGIDS